jgi:hypothetical protein
MGAVLRIRPETTKAPCHSMCGMIGITFQRNKRANTEPGYTGGGIRCLRGVSILCRPVTPIRVQFHDHKYGVIRCQSQCAKNRLTIGMNNVRQHMAQ